MQEHTLISSPLQSFTDYRFRNPFNKYFGGIDIFYAPYIRLNGKFQIKPVYERDLVIKHNDNLKVIPQVMTNSAEEFIFVAKYVKSLGYNELNWNLGCPYPMVTNKGMGAGLICQSEKIDEILDQVYNASDITISMKMRMGYEHPKEILDVFPILDKYPIKNIGIHARIGKQLYKGGVDLDAFEECVANTNQTLYYNGDITSLEFFNELKERFPSIKHWMIGRGLIANPFLPSIIKANDEKISINKVDVFGGFHQELLTNFAKTLTSERQTIMKMYSYWEYFSILFDDAKKELKKIKKAKSFSEYEEAADELIRNKLIENS